MFSAMYIKCFVKFSVFHLILHYYSVMCIILMVFCIFLNDCVHLIHKYSLYIDYVLWTGHLQYDDSSHGFLFNHFYYHGGYQCILRLTETLVFYGRKSVLYNLLQ